MKTQEIKLAKKKIWKTPLLLEMDIEHTSSGTSTSRAESTNGIS